MNDGENPKRRILETGRSTLGYPSKFRDSYCLGKVLPCRDSGFKYVPYCEHFSVKLINIINKYQ